MIYILLNYKYIFKHIYIYIYIYTRTLIDNYSIDLLINEFERIEIDIIGITETHWTTDIPTIREKD